MSGLEGKIAAGEIAPDTIICILGKTEGNGNMNDFTRGYATPALGEIAGPIDDHLVCRDATLFSARASTSAEIELMRNEIMVLGNSGLWSGVLVIGHDVMEDAIDLAAIQRA
jgi:hypothetical protein